MDPDVDVVGPVPGEVLGVGGLVVEWLQDAVDLLDLLDCLRCEIRNRLLLLTVIGTIYHLWMTLYLCAKES